MFYQYKDINLRLVIPNWYVTSLQLQLLIFKNNFNIYQFYIYLCLTTI